MVRSVTTSARRHQSAGLVSCHGNLSSFIVNEFPQNESWFRGSLEGLPATVNSNQHVLSPKLGMRRATRTSHVTSIDCVIGCFQWFTDLYVKVLDWQYIMIHFFLSETHRLGIIHSVL